MIIRNGNIYSRIATGLALVALLFPPVVVGLCFTPPAESSTALEILELRNAMAGAAFLQPGDTLTLESPDFALARFALNNYFVAPPERKMPARYVLRLYRDSSASPVTGGRAVWSHQSSHFFFTLIDRSAL